jgi:hypothetical protein
MHHSVKTDTHTHSYSLHCLHAAHFSMDVCHLQAYHLRQERLLDHARLAAPTSNTSAEVGLNNILKAKAASATFRKLKCHAKGVSVHKTPQSGNPHPQHKLPTHRCKHLHHQPFRAPLSYHNSKHTQFQSGNGHSRGFWATGPNNPPFHKKSSLQLYPPGYLLLCQH